MNLESPGRMPLTQWIAPRITSQYSATVGSRHQTNAHMLQTFSDGGHRWICDSEWFECPAALRLTNGLQYRHDLREFGNIGDHSHPMPLFQQMPRHGIHASCVSGSILVLNRFYANQGCRWPLAALKAACRCVFKHTARRAYPPDRNPCAFARTVGCRESLQ